MEPIGKDEPASPEKPKADVGEIEVAEDFEETKKYLFSKLQHLRTLDDGESLPVELTRFFKETLPVAQK